MDENSSAKTKRFHNDMTIAQFISALGDYNTAILDRVYNNQNFSDLLQEFEESKILENERYSEAFQVFNITQPEIYLGETGINITSEAFCFRDNDYRQSGDDDKGLGPLEYYQQVIYMATMPEYKSSITYPEEQVKTKDEYEDELKAFKELPSNFFHTYKHKGVLAKRLEAYRDMCKRWNAVKNFNVVDKDCFHKKHRTSHISKIQEELYGNILSMIEMRASFVPRYIVDFDGIVDNGDIEGIIEKLETLETFTERCNFLFGMDLTACTNQGIVDGYCIRPVKVTGGSVRDYLEKTIKTRDSEAFSSYVDYSKAFGISDLSRHFIVALFFYLCLPFSEFKDFLNYHGFAVTSNLPLIVGRQSLPDTVSKAYTEQANIFYEDIERLYNLGLSYNTLLTVLFGTSTYIEYLRR